jgi:hypothetical protein
MTVLTRTAYDRDGRSKAVCKQVFDANTLETGKYWEPVGCNGIGELTRRTLGCGIQHVDYAHNIRDWMTHSGTNPAVSIDFFAANSNNTYENLISDNSFGYIRVKTVI